jgi:hypothetical protein
LVALVRVQAVWRRRLQRDRMAMVEAAVVRMHALFRHTLGRWEAYDRAVDELPAWLEERCEAVEMLEEVGCGPAGWPLDSAEQDPRAPLRLLVVAGGLAVAVNGLVHIHAMVHGWMCRNMFGWLVGWIVRV